MNWCIMYRWATNKGICKEFVHEFTWNGLCDCEWSARARLVVIVFASCGFWLNYNSRNGLCAWKYGWYESQGNIKLYSEVDMWISDEVFRLFGYIQQ